MEPLLLPQVAGFIVDAIAVGPVGIGAIATVVVPDWQFVVINLDSNVWFPGITLEYEIVEENVPPSKLNW